MSARKKIFLYFLFLLFFSTSLSIASDFYVDAKRGSDLSGNGSKSLPFRTIQKATEIMDSGDVCVIRAGIYRETVTPKDNQTFRPYQKELVFITGCDVITGWTSYQGDIHKAAVPKKVYQVFAGKKRMYKARYPDEDGDMYSIRDFTPTFVTKRANDTGKISFRSGLDKNYVGGFVTSINGENCYQANMGLIAGQDGSELTVTHTSHRWNNSPEGKFHGLGQGFITDHLNALTSEKEWHWQNKTLYFYPVGGKHPDVHNQLIEARTRLYGFDCSGRKGIKIRGLHFKAAAILMDGSKSCLVDSCTFRYVSPWGKTYYTYAKTDRNHYTYGDKEDGSSGIHITGSNNTVQNCYIAYGWGALISLRGENHLVKNNIIEACNWQLRQDAVGVTLSGRHHRVIHNTFRKSNSMLLSMRDIHRQAIIAPVIKYNDFQDYGYVMVDGGTAAIYYNANSEMEGGEVAYNVIRGNKSSNHRVSCGIYFDDGSYNVKIHHNVVYSPGLLRNAVFTHRGSQKIYVYHNTFWGYSVAGWQSAVWDKPGHTRDKATMIYRNNLSSGRGFSTRGITDPITVDHNREYVQASELKNTQALDFRIVSPDSPAIDSGLVIPGINDDYKGEAPDLGAYEYGSDIWKAGSSVKVPEFIKMDSAY